MNEEIISLIKHRLLRAKETLEDAKILFEKGRYNSSVNRIYYALFYSVLALLRTKGLMSSKHSGVRALFHKEFIKANIIPLETGKFYDRMFINRQKGDYEDFIEFEKSEVSYCLKKAEQFIDLITRTVKNKIKGK